MSEESENSVVEISVGQNQLRVEGSEEFISDELSKILDRVDMTAPPALPAEADGGEEAVESEVSKPGEQAKLFDEPAPNQADTGEDSDTDTELSEVANRLNVEPNAISEYFFIDGDEVHIQDPMNIQPRYALLGYCSIKEILTGEQYHDNAATKKKLIDVEKVNISEWGGNLLYSLRQEGLIKDNPHTDKKRNKPFKITPPGREELVKWLNEDN